LFFYGLTAVAQKAQISLTKEKNKVTGGLIEAILHIQKTFFQPAL